MVYSTFPVITTDRHFRFSAQPTRYNHPAAAWDKQPFIREMYFSMAHIKMLWLVAIILLACQIAILGVAVMLLRRLEQPLVAVVKAGEILPVDISGPIPPEIRINTNGGPIPVMTTKDEPLSVQVENEEPFAIPVKITK